MNKSLRSKLVLSYFAIAILTALLIYLLIRLTSDQRLKSLVLEQQINEIQNEVKVWYETESSWNGFDRYFMALHPPHQPASNQNSPRPHQSQSALRGKHGILDADKRVLIRFLNFAPGEIVPDALLTTAVAVVVGGKTVAWVVPDDESGISLQAEEQVYLRRTNQVLLLATLLGIGSALLIGLGFARVLLRPIYALTMASEAMAQGKLKQQVDIHSPDELGRLAASFNSMSYEIALANQRRRQMTADIAHDLSQPLQIISGYIETMQDGTLAATPERLNIIATELDHLRRLIQDLDVLAQTDTKTLTLNLEPVELTAYLQRLTASFKPLAMTQAVDLQLDLPQRDIPAVRADRERLTQVMGNILNNALRYTPSGGMIRISARPLRQQVQLQVHDSGVGIAAEDVPFVFDRLYQTDQARSSAGKMGLGLAISKALVEAMGGEIAVDSPEHNQGTTFTVALPI